MTRKEAGAVEHTQHLPLWMANTHRETQLREAAEHRLGRFAAEGLVHDGLRRRVGRSLIRLGRTLAAEPETALTPARPR